VRKPAIERHGPWFLSLNARILSHDALFGRQITRKVWPLASAERADASVGAHDADPIVQLRPCVSLEAFDGRDLLDRSARFGSMEALDDFVEPRRAGTSSLFTSVVTPDALVVALNALIV
jgi:hypothetical protein